MASAWLASQAEAIVCLVRINYLAGTLVELSVMMAQLTQRDRESQADRRTDRQRATMVHTDPALHYTILH